MSCIRFSTPAQLNQLRGGAGMPVMLSNEQAASAHPMPAITAGKIHRLRLLAVDANPKIRESVASSLHAPRDLYVALASDPDVGVRGCVARNPAVPIDVLRSMLEDESELVRGWLVVNRATTPDMVEVLAGDQSVTVTGLVDWSVRSTA